MLLVIYYTKLSDLRNNKAFGEVKKSINRLEIIVMIVILLVLLSYFTICTLPNIVIYADKGCEPLLRKGDTSDLSQTCIVFNRIRQYAFYYYESLNSALIIILIIVFRHIKKTMKHKLFYYYKTAMKELKVLLISHGTFLVFAT